MNHLRHLNRILCRLGMAAYGISNLADIKSKGENCLKVKKLKIRLTKIANQVVAAQRLLDTIEREHE